MCFVQKAPHPLCLSLSAPLRNHNHTRTVARRYLHAYTWQIAKVSRDRIQNVYSAFEAGLSKEFPTHKTSPDCELLLRFWAMSCSASTKFRRWCACERQNGFIWMPYQQPCQSRKYKAMEIFQLCNMQKKRYTYAFKPQTQHVYYIISRCIWNRDILTFAILEPFRNIFA